MITHRFLQLDDRILTKYIKIKSSQKNNRPEMAKAIMETSIVSTTLLAAEMLRLDLGIYFIYKLMEEKVCFKSCSITNAESPQLISSPLWPKKRPKIFPRAPSVG